MTDTARTLAAIQALFADNSSRNISAQDLRDAIVSLVDPVEGGGFDTSSFGPGNGAIASANLDPGVTIGTPLVVPSGSPATFLPLADTTNTDYTFDPSGWFQFDDDYESPDWYGSTVPAGSWALLPEGVYTVHGFVTWDTNATGRRTFWPLDTCDNRVVEEDLDPWWAPTYWLYQIVGQNSAAAALGVFSGVFQFQQAFQILRVNRDTAPVAFATQVFQDSGTSRNIAGGGISIVQISDKG